MSSNFAIILNSAGLRFVKPLFFQGGKPLEIGGGDYPDIPIEEPAYTMDTNPSDAPVYGPLGTPVFADMILRLGTKEVNLNTVLITVSRQKTIVKTVLPYLETTVKQYVSANDYAIRINGVLASGKPDEFPAGEMAELVNMLNEPAALEVVSEYLHLFGIYQIVVEGYDMQQVQGQQNTQSFAFNAISDAPVELKLREDL